MNKDKSGKFVDFTTDFAGEKQKWFLPFKCKTCADVLHAEHGIICCHIGTNKCRCGGGLRLAHFLGLGDELDVDKLVKTLSSIE